MICKPKGRKHYIVGFRFNGKLIQRRTRAVSKKDARIIEARLRSELAKGNWGILESKPAPTLAEFLKSDFLPYTQSKFAPGSKTLAYYIYGADMLTKSDLASLPLNEITDQHARGFEARYSHLEKSTVNCGLRTLRRALNLAFEWSKLNRQPQLRLAKGENKRMRVLSASEAKAYLEACPQPWRDVATIMLGTGARPDEVYRLRWEQIGWRAGGGIIHMLKGKSDNAERPLPLLPEVYEALKQRHADQGQPHAGWVFPSDSASGHLMQGSAKNQHAKALQDCGVEPFAPYTLRHTGLTWIAPYCDAYTLARIAGHSSISMTMRYTHPQQNSIEQTFARIGSDTSRQKVITNGDDRMVSVESGDVESDGIITAKSGA
jgi:integrase